MISSVSVKHFQSLRDVTVDLGTLTVIVGPNDLGKSALFRAIRAASEGLAGTDFITYGHAKTSVTLASRDEGWSLKWEKGDGVNRYVLQHLSQAGEPTGDPTLYDRIGRTVPPDIDSLLALGTVDFDKDLALNLNFADQDDPPFLVPFPGGLTTSNVAKVLGDLTKLNLLFKAVREADTIRKRAEQAAASHVAQSSALTAELEPYADLGQRLCKQDLLDSLVERAKALSTTLSLLEKARDTRESLRSRYEEASTTLSSTTADLSPRVSALEDSLRIISRLSAARHHLVALDHDRALADQTLQAARTSEQKSKAELESLLQDTDTCPLCDQPMTKAHSHAAA